jgi:hypothetical protein
MAPIGKIRCLYRWNTVPALTSAKASSVSSNVSDVMALRCQGRDRWRCALDRSRDKPEAAKSRGAVLAKSSPGEYILS